MKECGHSFCGECANACLSRGSCPTCRTAVSGTVPNFLMRELVNALIVNCPHRGVDGSESGSEHRRGNDSEMIVQDSCTWTGTCEDYPNHEAVCEYKVITCGVGGCNHTCSRRDMNKHLTGSEFLRHIKLVEGSIEERHKILAKRDKEEIAGLKRHVKELEGNIKTLNELIETITSKVVYIENKVNSGDIEEIGTAVVELLESRNDDVGLHINVIKSRISGKGFNEDCVEKAVSRLCDAGHIYNTIDEAHFHYAF